MSYRLACILLLFTTLIALGACAMAPNKPAPRAEWLSPEQAIQKAKANPLYGAHGTFVMTVRRVGADKGMVYLDSRSNYRDAHNVTIVMPESVAQQLASRFDEPRKRLLIGQKIRVVGRAKRVHIDLMRNGRPIGKYYYQTHIDVDDPRQIRWVTSDNDGRVSAN